MATQEETQLDNNVLMTPETQPNDELMSKETQHDDEVLTQETQNNNVLMTEETQHNNGLVTEETQHNEGLVTEETQHNNGLVTEESQHNEGLVTEESQHNEGLVTEESQHNEGLVTEESQHNEGLVTEELQHNEGLVTEEMQHDEGLVTEETQHNKALVTEETQHDEGLVTEETQHDEGLVTEEMTHTEETQHDEGLVTEETQHDEGLVTEETQHDEGLVAEEMQHDEGLVAEETQQDEGLVAEETQNKEGLVTEETQHNEVLVTQESQHNNPSDVLMTQDMQPNNVLMTQETQPDDVLMTQETQPDDVLMTQETQPDDVLMTQETQPDDVLMTQEMQPDDVLMTEQLPDNTLAISEMQPNSELAITEMQPNNELAITEKQHYPNNQLAITERQPDNALAILNTQPNNEVTSPDMQPSKRRKKKSMVWEHFTIENVSPGCRRACCKQCKQSFAYSTGSKVAGTSHLKRHIAKGTCPALLRNQDNNNQLTPYIPRVGGSEPPKRRYRSPNLSYISFDQDRCRLEIARMIIMHDYPLHMVEHPGFITFVQNLQPRFDKVSFNTVQGDCVATYLREKHNLMKFIEGISGRFCLTLDMWTSSQTLGYVFITGHFIDSEWKLQRRILNVVMEPYPDSDTAFSHAVAACLSDWSLESKLFSLTFSHPHSEDGPDNLRPLLCIKNTLILNGQLLVRNCIARTLSSMAIDVVGSGGDIVKKIRDSVKYVKTSESHEEKFLELKQQLQVPSEKSLSLDDPSKWNTTYQMLVAASELKEVFSCLDTSDPDYKEAPSMEDWKLVETLCAFLKPLFDAANILTTSTTNPTAITFFHEAWKLLSDLTRSLTSEDPFVSSLTKALHEKMDRYWKDCCLVLALAVVMDPRFKMKLVEFSFTKIYGDDAPAYIKIVDDGIHELFLEYVALPLPLTPTYAEEGNNGRTEESQGGTLLSDNGLTDFDVYIMETSSHQMKSEVDQYLEESLLPRVQDFDVLGWWKLNKQKYPTLSKMARDILAIPVSSVGSDAVFDTASKQMDQYRSSLRPETVEALICAKDWFQYGGSAESSNAPVKMEF